MDLASSIEQATLKSAIHLAAIALVGNATFNQVLAVVNSWDEQRDFYGEGKRIGALKELSTLGLQLDTDTASYCIEAAVQYRKLKSGGIL